MVKGIAALGNLPPHRQTLLLSENSCNWDFHDWKRASLYKHFWHSTIHCNSACSISVTVTIPSTTGVLFLMIALKCCTIFCTITVTRNSFCNALNHVQSSTSPMPPLSVAINKLHDGTHFISTAHSSSMVISWLLTSEKYLATSLVHASKAELLPTPWLKFRGMAGQQDYPCLGNGTSSLQAQDYESLELLCSNCFHSLSSPLIQYSATIKSVKHCPQWTLMTSSSAESTWVISLARRRQDNNSR